MNNKIRDSRVAKKYLTDSLFAFRAGNNFWWIPVVGPMVGAFFGGLFYILLIQLHHSDPDSEVKAEPSGNKLEKYELSDSM